MFVDIGTPSPKQEEFLLAKNRFIAHGGARGGGKSWGGAHESKAVSANQQPGGLLGGRRKAHRIHYFC